MDPFFEKYANDLLEDAKNKIRSLIKEASGKVVNFEAANEFRKLENKLLQFQTLLDSFHPSSQTSQHWIGEVNRVCYDAEDLVDDFKGASTDSMVKQLVKYFTKDEFPEKIKELRGKLELIITTLDKGCKTAQSCKDKPAGKQKMVIPDKLIGRDIDKDKIIAMLLQDNTAVVSIFGMAGLGKTTLAHHVINDPRVKFDHIEWVNVSSKFDSEKISSSILRERQNGECSFPLDRKQVSSEDHILGRGILIVLDDIWEVTYTEWNFFQKKYMFFPGGCKVLITTSNPYVTEVSKATQYNLELMKDEDIKAIIKDRAFSFGNFSERDRNIVEGVTARMAEKCKGLPLAANVLGLFLSSDHGVDKLMTLSTSDIREFKVYNEEIFPIFNLNMEFHLKRCLAYGSLFPCNSKLEKQYLVELWMAEGLLGTQGTTSLEQVGYDYFDKLLCRSVFQFSNLDDQKIPTYIMHEFIHKFAEVVASNTYSRMEEGECLFSSSWYKNVRHLSLLCHKVELNFLEKLQECHSLRTLLFLSEQGTDVAPIPYGLFIKLGRLKVLNLSHTNIEELPDSLGTIKHLRYLDASHTLIRGLPWTTSKLHELQILKLRDCSKLLKLPNDIDCLTNLQQLDVHIKMLRCMPPNIGSLIHLKTLSNFIVGKKNGHHITELKNLNFLSGTICISKLEYVMNDVQAREAMISSKHFLKRLELKWSACSEARSGVMEVLNGLEPPANLEELQVLNYDGSSFPAWLTSPNFNLVILHLINCKHDDVLPPLGQLPFLQKLHIEGLHRVKYVDSHFCGQGENAAFPKLESLKIANMLCFEKWFDVPGNSMLQLRKFQVEDCPKLLEISSLKHLNSLKELQIYNCMELMSLPVLPTSLESFIIVKCVKVATRCEPEKGCDWSMIKSIQYKDIDYGEAITGDF